MITSLVLHTIIIVEITTIVDNFFINFFHFFKFQFEFLPNLQNNKDIYLNELGSLLYSYLIPKFNSSELKQKEKNIKSFFIQNLPFYTELINYFIINYEVYKMTEELQRIKEYHTEKKSRRYFQKTRINI